MESSDRIDAVRSAARLNETHKKEPKVLGVLGAGLLLMAGFLLWQELAVQAEVLMVVGSGAMAVVAVLLSRNKAQLIGPLALLATSGAAGIWFLINREPVLLLALGLAFGAALLTALWDRARRELETPNSRWHRLVSWQAVAASGLVFSFATYFQLFDASDLVSPHFAARRSILSLAWLVAGIGLVLFGRSRKASEIRDAGFLVLAAAVGKLVFYDTAHLHGWLRIGTLAVAGTALVGASLVARRLVGQEGH